MKKILALVLALMLVLSMFSLSLADDRETVTSADGTTTFYREGLPIVDPDAGYKITMWGVTTAADPNNFEMILKMEEDTGIDFDIIAVSSDGLAERRNLMWASGDYPNVMGPSTLSGTDVDMYGPMGILVNLKPLIDEYMTTAPTWVTPEQWSSIWNQLTYPNGEIYCFPTVTAYYLTDSTSPSINVTWLKQLGMEMPTTPDEFVEYLRAVKATDLNGNGQNDEIPMTTQNWEGVREAYAIAGFVGEMAGKKYVVDGQVVYPLTTDAVKEAAHWLHDLWTEGLIDPEIYTQTQDMLKGKAQGEELIYGFSTVWREGNVFGEAHSENYFPMAPLEGADGKRIWYGNQDTTYVGINWSITASCPAPEIIVRLIDYMWDPYISMQNNYGPFGIAWEVIDDPAYPDGMYKQISPEGFSTIGEWFVDNHFQQVPRLCLGFMKPGENGANNGYGLEWIDPEMPTVEEAVAAQCYKLEDGRQITGGKQKDVQDAVTGPYVVEKFPPVKPLQEETDELTILEPDFQKYVDECLTRFITGDMDIDAEWDTYVSTIESLGYERLMEIYQTQYNRYYGIE